MMHVNKDNLNDVPPAYDESSDSTGGQTDSKAHPNIPRMNPPAQAPSVYPGFTQPSSSSPQVYHYTNPTSGQMVASLLPPDHPEMICLQAGEHLPESNFGVLGILAAVFWFPLGIGLCLLDRQVKCKRCGFRINDGLCR